MGQALLRQFNRRSAHFVLLLMIGNLIIEQASAEDFYVEKTSSRSAIIRLSDLSQIEFTEVGDKVRVENENGSACTLVVTQVGKSKIKVNSTACRKAARLRKGQTLKDLGTTSSISQAESDSGFDEEVTEAAPVRKQRSMQRPVKFGIGLSLILPSTIEYPSIPNSSGAKAKVRFDSSFAIALEARNSKPNAWGFNGGISYELSRKFSEGVIETPSGNLGITQSGTTSGLQIISLFFNPIYRWGSTYLFFGLNFSSANKVGDYPATRGDLGFQVGSGYQISDRFSIELASGSTALNSEVFGRGNLVGLTAGLKALF